MSSAHQSAVGTILFAMDEGGNEHDALFLLSPDSGVMTALTADPSSIHRPGPWSPDGRRVAYAVNNRDRRYFDIYLLDLSFEVGEPVRFPNP
ncbi:MAG: TolB family protein, partial [Dehalococcoidia bacterium]